jgi:hypothetical protein
MLRVLFTIECDECNCLFGELRDTGTRDTEEWANNAWDLNDTANLVGWCFNPNTNKHWCTDCRAAMRG